MRVKHILQEKGLTQKDLAKELGLTPTGLSIAINEGGNPTLKRLQQIANALDVPIWQLFVSPEEIVPSSNTLQCPYCHRPIRVTLAAEPVNETASEPQKPDLVVGNHYRFRNPRTREEQTAIFELQTLPDEGGECSVRNINPAGSDSSEVLDVDASRLVEC